MLASRPDSTLKRTLAISAGRQALGIYKSRFWQAANQWLATRPREIDENPLARIWAVGLEAFHY